MGNETDADKRPAAIRERLRKPVVFVGMMGSGKSHIGFIFARAVGLPMFDSDALIERRAQKKISEIFAEKGEAQFRAMEKDAISELINNKDVCVIATGGGAVTNPETLALLKEKALIVWLDVDAAELVSRIPDVSSRPLLAKGNPVEILKELSEERRPLYKQAHIHINSTGLTSEQTLEKLIKSLYESPDLG